MSDALAQLSAPLSREQAYALVDAIMERDGLALTASAHEDPETGEWIFEATCAGEPDLAAFAELARLTLGGDVAFSSDRIDPEVNWVARSLEGLAPVTAGGFYIHGSHQTAAPPANLIAIRIDAAEAFGTGHHETTSACLEAIDIVLQRPRPPRYLLDLGTGTGVLAIALAKRLDEQVVATDIDPVAVRTAAANAEANGVGQLVVAIEAIGLDHPTIGRHAPYELIVANILAQPLMALAQDIAGAARIGASVILSGLLDTQSAEIVAAYAAHGVVLRQQIVRKEWATLILERV